jgi:cytochrome c5
MNPEINMYLTPDIPTRDTDWLSLRFMLPILAFAVISLGSMLAQAQSTGAQPSSKPAPSAQRATQDAGERKFQANCSRCHNAPEQLSPQIVGTVVRHMRIRASLSAQDEHDILKYLAP